MYKHLLVLATCLAFALGSCSNPMSKAYSDKTVGEDLKAITEAGKLDTTQRQLLAMYLVRAQMTKEPLIGTTYQEILNKAEALKAKAEKEQAEQQALAAKAEAEATARMAQLREAVTVAVYHKSFQDSDYQSGTYEDFITLKMAIQNKSAKDIKALTGTVVFADLFNKPIKKVRFTYDEPLKAGKTNNYPATLKYNQFMPEDQELKSKGIDKMKITWEPEQILFADGTTMGAEEQSE